MIAIVQDPVDLLILPKAECCFWIICAAVWLAIVEAIVY